MGVIHGFSPPWRAADCPTGAGPRVDRWQAILFLRAQAAWLRRGLDRADDRATVGIILGSHDASHDSWLALIRALGAVDGTSADAVAALYTYHGRVVGFLEAGLDRGLSPAVRDVVRTLMSARLHRLTESAVGALGELGASGEPTAPAIQPA